MNYIHIYVCLCTYAEPNASANSLNPLVLNEIVYIFSVADRESLSADEVPTVWNSLLNIPSIYKNGQQRMRETKCR